MNKLRITRFFAVLVVGIAFLGVSATGCSDDETTPEVEAKKSYIRVIHLSPDAPGVDVFVNGTSRVIQNLEFADGTDYLEVDEGTYSFNVSAAGSMASESVLDIENISLMGDKYYTAIAYNELSGISALAIEDDFSGLSSDNIRVRAIHAAAAVGQVDIWNIPETGDPSLLYENVDFGVAGETIDIPAGAYTLGFDVDNDMTPDVIFELPSLAAGTIANVFAVNDSSGNVFLNAQFFDSSLARIDASEIQPEIAEVRVIHLSPDAPAVDVLVNDWIDPVVSGLGFGSSTGYLEVDAGEYNFHITPAGGRVDNAVLHLHGFDLMDKRSYTAVAFDSLDSIQGLFLEDRYDMLESGNIRVRAIHAAAAVGQVDIWAIFEMGDPLLLYENVDFGVAGNYLDLSADAYTLGFDVNDDAIPDVIFDLPGLNAGTVANVFAVNDSGGTVFLLAQFADGSTARIDAR
jgi:hypothetical protein